MGQSQKGVAVFVAVAVLAVVPLGRVEGQEAGATCAGRPVTISWDDPEVGTTINGTSGPDVIQGGPRSEVIRVGGGADVVCGGGGPDFLNGGSGRDELLGQGDSDLFQGAGLAQDLVTGGSRDRDSADYSGSVGVYVDTSTGLVQATGSAVNGGILGVEAVGGTAGADTLRGREGAESFYGEGGDDVIKGRGGDDTLEGGGGDDVIFPGQGDDWVDGGANDPVTGTSAAGDLVSYQGEPEDPDEDFDAWLSDPFTHRPPGANGVGDDRFVDVESLRAPRAAAAIIDGDDGPNVLIGGDKVDAIEGFGGNDLIFGLDGPDSISGDAGDDHLDGGGGQDVIDGGEGTDVCRNSEAGFRLGCETVT